MEIGLLDGREDAEHNVFCLLVISKIFVMHDNYFYRTAPFENDSFTPAFGPPPSDMCAWKHMSFA